MKICIFISTLLAGGAERKACMLANYLAKNNDVKLLTFQKSNKSNLFLIFTKIVYYNILKKYKNLNYFLIKIYK